MVTEKDEERQRLLRAARLVLVRNGWQGLKVGSVGRQADVSIRTFYKHFGTKDELLVAVLRDNVERLAGDLWVEARRDLPARERVEAWIDRLMEISQLHPSSEIAAMFSRNWHLLRSEFPEALRDLDDRLVASLTHVLVDLRAEPGFGAVRPDLDARAIFRLVAGFNAAILNDESDLSTDDARTVIVPFVHRALRS